MMLQLLALALLTFALARPVLNLITREAHSVFIVIDASASMAMRAPGGESRIDEAKDKAIRLLASLPDKSPAAIIEYADRASVVEPMTSDRARARQAIGAIESRATNQDLGSALSLVASLVASAPNPRVVVFSDSAEITQRDLEQLGSTPVTIEPCGEPGANFGWTAADLRRQSSTTDAYDLFAQVASFGSDAGELVVELRSGDRILEARKIELDADSETSLVIEGLPLAPGEILNARIAPPEGNEDLLGIDNEVWIRAPEIEKPRLLFCTPGNYFLSRALLTAGTIDVVEVAPGAPVPEGKYDLAIYDRARPETLPDVPALFIALNPWTNESQTDEANEIGAGPITTWDSEHPLTSSIQWPTITVFGAQPIEPPDGTRNLLESGELPLLILGRFQNQPAVVMTFDLFRSNFPLRAGFPIFVKAAVDWLTRANPATAPQFLKGGETFTMRVPEETRDVRVVSPGGERWMLAPSPERTISFGETYSPGLWKIESAGATLSPFAVNLLNLNESNPAVVDPVTATEDGTLEREGLAAELKSNREIWRWLAAAALALLALEWMLYRRGVGV